MSDDPIVYAFHADGAARLLGVPNRSLSQRDIDNLPPDLRREVKASSLYRAVTPKKETPPKKETTTQNGGEG